MAFFHVHKAKSGEKIVVPERGSGRGRALFTGYNIRKPVCADNYVIQQHNRKTQTEITFAQLQSQFRPISPTKMGEDGDYERIVA